MNRRRFLVGTTGGAVVAGLSGCLGFGDDDDTGDGNGDDDNGDDANGGESVAGTPTATFDWSPETPAADEEVTFDASDSSVEDGDIVEYRWTFGDAEKTATGPESSHIFGDLGEKEVTLVVETEAGETDETTELLSLDEPEALEEVRTLLVENAQALEAMANLDSQRDQEDVTEVESRATSVESTLSELDGLGGESLQTRLDELESVLAFQQTLTEGHRKEIEVEDQFLTAISDEGEVPEPEDEDREYFASIATELEVALSLNEDRQVFAEEIQTAHDGVSGTFDNPALDYSGDPVEYVRYSPTELAIIGRLIGMYIDYFTAIVSLSDGLSEFWNEQWESAVDTFTTADEYLGEAQTEFESFDGDADAERTLGAFAPALQIEAALGMLELLQTFITDVVEGAETAAGGAVADGNDIVDAALAELDELFGERPAAFRQS